MGFVTSEISKKLKEKGFPLVEYIPTISHALKWLREERHLHFEVVATAYGYNLIISDTPDKGGTDRYHSHANHDGPNYAGAWDKYEDCVIYGIKYVLNNLIDKFKEK